MRASYQQKNKETQRPPPNAKIPSKTGPAASADAVLTTAVSEAITVVKTPVWFSLRSNHPMFF